MILSPQVWPRMAVAYFTGGLRKEALYATNAPHSGFRKEDVDETIEFDGWKEFIGSMLAADDGTIEGTIGSNATIGSNGTNRTLTIKQISDAAMRALRLQTLNEMSKLMAAPLAVKQITKALNIARAMVEDKTPPPKIDINNGVIVQMVSRRQMTEDRGLMTDENVRSTGQTITIEQPIEKLAGHGSTKGD